MAGEAGAHVGFERAHHRVGFEVDVDADLGGHGYDVARYSDVIVGVVPVGLGRDEDERAVGHLAPAGIVVERFRHDGRPAHEQGVAVARGRELVAVGEQHVEAALRDRCDLLDDARQRRARRVAGVETVERQGEQHLGVGVAFDAGEALRAELGAQLVVDALAESADRPVEREQPRPGDERRVAARVDRGSRRREPGRAEERAALDASGTRRRTRRRPRSA